MGGGVKGMPRMLSQGLGQCQPPKVVCLGMSARMKCPFSKQRNASDWTVNNNCGQAKGEKEKVNHAFTCENIRVGFAFLL